jgi:hypothetical protein
MIAQRLPSLRCKAHWQNAQSQGCDQILPKSLPALPTPTHGQKNSAAKIKAKIMKDKNGQLVTKAKCNKGFSGLRRFVARLNFSCNLTENRPQSLTALSLDR